MRTIILDHDAGTNPDDFLSLLMLLNSSDVDLKLIISGNNHSLERARFAHKIIAQPGSQESQYVQVKLLVTLILLPTNILRDMCQIFQAST